MGERKNYRREEGRTRKERKETGKMIWRRRRRMGRRKNKRKEESRKGKESVQKI